MSADTLIAVIGALGGLAAVLITSLRKREDTELEELRRENKRLNDRVATLVIERDAAQLATETARGLLHRVRVVLADNGWDDPTTL